MNELEVRLLGNPEIRFEGEPISLPYKKAEGFFYYLAVKGSVTREEVVNLLWADEDEISGKKKLRDVLYQVRRAMTKEVLITTGHTAISLNPDFPFKSDLKDPAAKGSFLEHFYIRNCYEFEEWTEQMRKTLAEQSQKSAREGLEEAMKAHDTAKMQQFANTLLSEDPYNEELYASIMTMYAQNGDYNMAIRLYYDLVRLLKKELDAEPGDRVKKLFRRIFNMKENVPKKAHAQVENLPFFGREKELFEISGMLDEDSGSTTNVVMVEGEEGLGKTAFLSTARDLAAGRKMVPLYALCYQNGADFFMSSWTDIFQEILQQVEAGRLTVGENDPFTRLKSLLAGQMGDAPENGRLRYQMIERTILEIFEKMTEQRRVVLCFDDIQWMDQISLQLLVRMVRSVDPGKLKVICSYERVYETDVMRQLELLVREDRIRFIELQPFSEEETVNILKESLPELREQSEDLHRIYEMTEGNAFFLKEMVSIIREKGFTLEKTPKINLVLQNRLDGLTREERDILGCMSVFPEKINMSELELLVEGSDRLRLLRILDSLQQRNLIQEVPVGWYVYYKFVHRIFQEYIYDGLSEGTRQFYHRTLAEYYQANEGGDFASLPLIAYHYRGCHDEVHSYQCQIRYLREFYTILDENFPVMHSEVADLGEDFGVMAEAEKMLGLAENVVRLEDESREVQVMKMQMHYILGRHAIAAGNYEEGIPQIEGSMSLAEKLGEQKDLLSCYKQEIFHGIQTSDLNQVSQFVTRALSLLEKKDAPDEYATFLRFRGWLRVRKGDVTGAEIDLRNALTMFRKLEDSAEMKDRYRSSAAACLNYLGDSWRSEKDLETALRYYNEAVSTGQGRVATNGMAQVYSNIGQVKYLQKRYAESYIYLDKAREILEKNGYKWSLERTEAFLCLVCIATDRSGEAWLHFDKAQMISDRIRNPQTQKILDLAKDVLKKRADRETVTDPDSIIFSF